MQKSGVGRTLFGLLIVMSGFQNCSSPKSSSGTENNSSLSIYDSIEVFSKTLHPKLMENCGTCHGSFQEPMFAVVNPGEALNTIHEFDLVNLDDPSNSRFIQKIGEGHNGFPQEVADTLHDAIVDWANGDTDPTPTPSAGDRQSPTIRIVTPLNNASVNGNLSVQVNATDNIGVAKVTIQLNGIVRGQSTASPFAVSINTQSLPDGTYVLRAIATDAAGNEGVSPNINIQVDNSNQSDFTPPTVSIISPTQNATVTGTLTIQVNAQDNVGVSMVSFYLNGGTLIGQDSSPPYQINWDSKTVVSGRHTIEAWATDSSANFASSTPVTFNVTGGKVINNPNARYSWIATNILQPRCTECHGATRSSRGIRLHTHAFVLETVSPPNPNVSPLYSSVLHGSMPPGSANDLNATQLKAIADWIELGAPNN